MSARYDMCVHRATRLNRCSPFHYKQHDPYTTDTHPNRYDTGAHAHDPLSGRCTLRIRLWLWILTLVFAGFTLHTSICACEVVHPHHGSTKPCIVRCHTTTRPQKTTAQLA